ncbi:MAG: ABC transporter ATP-binding protein [Novosphingobium sp.]|jgi:energy-coupling factor transporter ATP-binding protein EcfA2|nr:ABC transporter ATP-binding protein [Novosphingobium sp.]
MFDASPATLKTNPVAAVRDLTVHCGGRDILSHVSFDLPRVGIVGLVGPMGSGKSTLLHFLAGDLEKHGLAARFASACYRDAPLGAGNYAALIGQRPREEAGTAEESAAAFMQRRARLLEHAGARETALLCVDEPTAGLLEPDGRRMMALLAELARDRSIVLVSHNLTQLRGLCDRILLMSAGRILRDVAGEAFFRREAGPEAAHFLDTRNLALPRIDTEPRHLAPEFRQAAKDLAAHILPEGGSGWIIPNRLWLRKDNEIGSETAPFADTPIIYRIENGHLTRTGPGTGSLTRWPNEDRDLLSAAASLRRDVAAATGIMIEAETDGTATASRFLGAFLIRMGLAPETAFTATERCLPEAAVQHGFEQWLWDMDLIVSLED